jgi:hypothetical protein
MSPAPTAQYTAVRLVHGHQRFPISTPVKYIVEKVVGEGVTCNVGSDGLLMKTTCVFPQGRRIELSLDWPAMLDGRLPVAARHLRQNPVEQRQRYGSRNSELQISPGAG